MSILKAREVYKSFGETRALIDVDFSLNKGEVHALIGQNGAGKSTFSRIVAGDLQKDYGKIFINDEEKQIKNCFAARELGISMIYQELKLVPDITAAENIFINSYNQGNLKNIKWKEVFKKTEELLESWDLNVDPKSVVGDLSIANQQLIEIMRSVVLNPKIIIMDEPTSSLGYHEIQSLFKLMNNLKKQEVSIIYISHVLEEVFQIADRITVFRDGKNRCTFEKKHVTPNEVVEEMLGKKLSISTGKNGKEKSISKEPILEAKNISKKGLLENINLELRKGEIIGIAGLVGAGKTELGNCLSGLLQIDSGSIIVNGREVRLKSITDGINNSIGLIPEDRRQFGIFSTMSVKENFTIIILKFLTKLGFINKKKEKEKLKSYKENLNIKYSNPEQEIENLSGGNQQKVIIARWLVTNPKILIADEPTRGVDIGTKREIHNLFRKIANEGSGIIMFSEEVEEILAVADRIIVLKNGKIVKKFDNTTVSPHEIILSMTGGNNK